MVSTKCVIIFATCPRNQKSKTSLSSDTILFVANFTSFYIVFHSILENSSENIRTIFSIIQAYILLDAEVYLQQHGKNIVDTCMYLLSDLRSEGIVMVMRLFESILRATGDHGVSLLQPALPIIFKCV